MIPASQTINLTQGDTSPLVIQLTAVTDAGTIVASDAAEVTMRIATDTVTEVAGISEGAANGSFAFPLSTIPAGNYYYQIVVEDDGNTDTWVAGVVKVAEAIVAI